MLPGGSRRERTPPPRNERPLSCGCGWPWSSTFLKDQRVSQQKVTPWEYSKKESCQAGACAGPWASQGLPGPSPRCALLARGAPPGPCESGQGTPHREGIGKKWKRGLEFGYQIGYFSGSQGREGESQPPTCRRGQRAVSSQSVADRAACACGSVEPRRRGAGTP